MVPSNQNRLLLTLTSAAESCLNKSQMLLRESTTKRGYFVISWAFPLKARICVTKALEHQWDGKAEGETGYFLHNDEASHISDPDLIALLRYSSMHSRAKTSNRLSLPRFGRR